MIKYTFTLHQDLYQKLIKSFSNYILIHIIENILNEEDFDLVIDEIVNNNNFSKSDCEIKTHESMEELKLPEEYEDGGIVILDDLNENEMNDPRI